MTIQPKNPTWLGELSAVWGILGVSGLLGSAVVRLSAHTFEAVMKGLSAWEWVALFTWLAFMLYSEGYRGFQRGFSPRVASRAAWLRQHPGPLRSLLAPLFCMGFFGATRKRQTVSYILTTAIIGLILLVRLLPQPWRGIVDAGVVAGLLWGLLALWVFAFRTCLLPQNDPPHDPELSPQLKLLS